MMPLLGIFRNAWCSIHLLKILSWLVNLISSWLIWGWNWILAIGAGTDTEQKHWICLNVMNKQRWKAALALKQINQQPDQTNCWTAMLSRRLHLHYFPPPDHTLYPYYLHLEIHYGFFWVLHTSIIWAVLNTFWGQTYILSLSNLNAASTLPPISDQLCNIALINWLNDDSTQTINRVRPSWTTLGSTLS